MKCNHFCSIFAFSLVLVIGFCSGCSSKKWDFNSTLGLKIGMSTENCRAALKKLSEADAAHKFTVNERMDDKYTVIETGINPEKIFGYKFKELSPMEDYSCKIVCTCLDNAVEEAEIVFYSEDYQKTADKMASHLGGGLTETTDPKVTEETDLHVFVSKNREVQFTNVGGEVDITYKVLPMSMRYQSGL